MPGRRAEALGLAPGGDHMVVSARAADGGEGATELVVRALAREEARGAFVVPRHGEVVAILPVYVRRGPRDCGPRCCAAPKGSPVRTR